MVSTSAPWSGGGWPPWAVHALLEELQRQRRRGALRDPLHWPANPRIAVYTVGRNGHPIRIDNALFGPSMPGISNGWLTDKYSSNTERWRLPDLQRFHIDTMPAPAPQLPTPPAASARSKGWDNATYGWAAGAVMLAVLVLIVRATEKCLDKKLFKRNRRQSDEWPRPNVLATSLQHPEVSIGVDAPYSIEGSQTTSNDLPPPYSECANKVVINVEEPPPPYSACYVAFSNPKDGIPSVHFFNRRRQDMLDRAECSNSRSDINTPIVEVTDTETNNDSERLNIELIFENGRIVERETSNNDVSVTSNDTEARGVSDVNIHVSDMPCDVVVNV